MARGFAHVTLVGNLTRDPELRQPPSGTSVCELSVAVESSYKDSAAANGSRRPATSTWWSGERKARTAPST